MPCDANAEPVTGEAIPMHQIQPRPSLGLSPHVFSFAAGVGVTLLVMYLCSQWGGKRSRD
jgi:hypothetical protein